MHYDHEKIGPVLVVTVPGIRKSQGYVSPARIPDTYPRKPLNKRE